MRHFLLLSVAFTTCVCTERTFNANSIPIDNGRISREATSPTPNSTRHHFAHHTGRQHSIKTSLLLGKSQLGPQNDLNRTNIQSSHLPPPRSRGQRKSDVWVKGHSPETYHRDRQEPTGHPRFDEPSRRDHSYDKSQLSEKGDTRSYQPGSAWLRAPPLKLFTGATSNIEQFTVHNRLSPSRCDILRRSSRYSVECNATGSGKPFPLLVTGVGRSGTSFLQVQARGAYHQNITYPQ